jgi:hypothetical protein
MKIACSERDKLLFAESGVVGLDWGVEASLTDIYGEFGEPRIETTWGGLGGIRIKDVRHPDANGGKDVEPCEHYLWVEEEVVK